MDVQVKVVSLLPEETFVSKRDGSQVVRHSFIGETLGQYPKKMKFDVVNSETWLKMGLRVGMLYNVGFDADSREWNGRWFTSLNAWRAFAVDGSSTAVAGVDNNTAVGVASVANAPVVQPAVQSQSQSQVVNTGTDIVPPSQDASDLPF